MPVYTDLNDTNVDGVASSAFQGEFLGTVRSMPSASAELEGRLVLYVGSTGAYVQYAYYICLMNADGTWGWRRQDLAPPYTLTAQKVAVSDSAGKLVSSDITTAELDTLAGIEGNVQSQIDTKEDKVVGAAMTITKTKLSPQRALVSDANGNVAVSQTTGIELLALHGLKSPIQDQFDDKVDKTTTVNGHALDKNIEITASDVGALPTTTVIPSKTSDLVNDSDFVTSQTSSLANYYTKAETYTKAEVNNLIVMVPELQYRAVDALPPTGDSGYIYIIPVAEHSYCEQYIWSEAGWVYLGTTQVEPDISQDAQGIVVNGTALQGATTEQTGLMDSQYVSELREAYDGFWTGGKGYVDSAGLHLTFDKRDGETVEIPAIAMGSQGEGSIVSDYDHEWSDFVTYLDSSYFVGKDFDVQVFTPGRFGETNTLISTIHILKGTYNCILERDYVFSNAESNSRVGVRVLFQHDGTIRVFDANGIEATMQTKADYVQSDERVYRIVLQRIVFG